MKESVYRTYEELPLFLNAEMVARVLGVSPSSGYELMHVVTNSVSLTPPQAARLAHFVAPPLPTQTLCALVDKGLISTEDTSVFTRDGLKHNGSLLYTIQPFQKVLDAHHQSQLEELELTTARWEYVKTASL